MKLQKQLSRRFRGKEYPKWVIVLPPEVVNDLGWKEGQDLSAAVERGSLLLRAVRSRKETSAT